MKDVKWIAALVLFAGTGAVAQSGRYTATLAQPLAGKKEVIIDHNIWRCEASTCILASVPEDPASIRNCHALVRKVGELKAYGPAETPFEADKLAKCNSGS
jgi:hypothetical protein